MQLLQSLSVMVVSACMCAALNFDDVTRISNEELRIYGGDDADASKVQYIGSLRKSVDGETYCGSALIASQYLVTAAHCVKNTTMYVSLGSRYRTGDKEGERIEVKESYVHPQYDATKHLNDVAILKLEKPTTIKPLALCNPDGSDNKENIMAVVRGWGMTENGKPSDVLKELNVRIQSNAQCNKLFNNRITEGMLCAGEGGGKDSCQGDSGGPLVNGDILIGIVSWGGTCGEKPGVYTRLTSVLDFINEKIGRTAPAVTTVAPDTIAPAPTTAAPKPITLPPPSPAPVTQAPEPSTMPPAPPSPTTQAPKPTITAAPVVPTTPPIPAPAPALPTTPSTPTPVSPAKQDDNTPPASAPTPAPLTPMPKVNCGVLL